MVGGGIAGIFAALLWARRGASVRLIEAADKVGGLLTSFDNGSNVTFDCGTHILKQTGNPGLDELLFGQIDNEKWRIFDRLKSGGYFGGELCSTSQFIDLRVLPDQLRNAAVYDLLSAEPMNEVTELDAKAHASANLGATITEEIIESIIAKLFGVPLEEMHPSALGLVGLTRFGGFDRFQSQEVKRSEFFDEKLGFSTWNDGVSDLDNYYPRSGGIQRWIDELVEKLEALGVTVETGCRVTDLKRTGEKISSIETDRGRFDVDELCWTVAPALLLKTMQLPLPTGVTPPQFRSSALIHGIVDRDFDSDLYFYYCHDPEMISYRTTLYSNLRSTGAGEPPFNFTVEVMGDADTVSDPDLGDRVVEEMRTAGVIGSGHELLYLKVTSSLNGFPIPTMDFEENARLLSSHCEELVDNLTLLGRATGRTHFMQDVLMEIWEVLGESHND